MPRTHSAGTQPTTPTAVVIGIEMPGFVKCPVSEQLKARENLNQRLREALRPIRHQDRIVLDTGSGVAIALFGRPSIALAVTSVLRRATRADENNFSLRVVLTTGPVQALPRENGEVQIAGDSLDVAERILALPSAEPVLATRAFADALRSEAPGCDAALKSLGTITDDQVRQHELYSLEPAHPSFAALERAQSARGWRSLPRAALASIAIALCAILWSSLASLGHAPDSNASAGVARTSKAIEAGTPMEPPLRSELPGTDITIVEERSLDIPPVSADKAIVETLDEHQAPSEISGMGDGQSITVAAARPAPDPGPSVKEASIENREVLPARDTGRGKLVLAIAPWGEVFIDGQSVGISPPLNELKLSPGLHYLEVRNGGFAPVLKRIEVQANETLKIRHRFADAR